MKPLMFPTGMAALFLIGCNPPMLQPNDLQTVSVGNVSIQVPAILIVRPSADGHRVIDNDFNNNDLDKLDEYRVEVFPGENESCASSLTGASKMDRLSGVGGNTQWGRFSDNDMTVGGGYPNSLCFGNSYVSDACAAQKEPFQFCDSGFRNYALCSEKDGKTVVICLSQAKDDPKMAEDIFKTFRWTE